VIFYTYSKPAEKPLFASSAWLGYSCHPMGVGQRQMCRQKALSIGGMPQRTLLVWTRNGTRLSPSRCVAVLYSPVRREEAREAFPRNLVLTGPGQHVL